METKIQIRNQILKNRNFLLPKECMEKSQKVVEQFVETSFYKDADTLFLYADFKNEVATDLLFDICKQDAKRVYYPRMEASSMDFYYIEDRKDLIKNKMGIREPSVLSAETVFKKDGQSNQHLENITMILPGVAFDSNFHRIGYGKGYYDKYLEKYPIKRRVAFAYELQMVDEIPINAYDYPVTMIITENQIRINDNKDK